MFNDAIRCRQDAHQAGEKISPTEVQRRVITQAENCEERAWLAEVASVALVRSVRDALSAYGNFCDSIKGKRKGRKVGRQRFKSRKDSRPSFRLARNGFRVRPDGVLFLAKVGDVAVRWSRGPRHLARKQRKLARLEREKSRQRVAVHHVRVARARRDYHHEQALALVRDNQAVYVEDFVRLLEEKAERCGRSVIKVSRWLPSPKTCSTCGHLMNEMALKIRRWICPACTVVHDRDHKAALNILAAGRAERPNAGGAHAGPSSGKALGHETGSIPGTA